MKKKCAEQIVKILLECSASLNNSISIVKLNSDKDETEKYRRMVGKIMGLILIEFLNPTFQKFPELKPDDFD